MIDNFVIVEALFLELLMRVSVSSAFEGLRLVPASGKDRTRGMPEKEGLIPLLGDPDPKSSRAALRGQPRRKSLKGRV